ncbi:MAG: sporulation initiation factor Spo0A C-terminal domain-containing protein, partial [Ruminococcus sp.]|nr:sporulation initiation factor Spo0A C-terminal domain-containing protein [Ruminococcus sp.]
HELYPIIAEKHNVTSLSVERATRNSIELAYDRNHRKFEELFGYKLLKPTNTEFVAFCAEKIRLELF